MDILQHLKKDHETVYEICRQLLTVKNEDQCKELFTKLKSELETHTEIEEKLLYPELKNTEETKHFFYESLAEHHLVENLLDELDPADKENPEWLAKFNILKENLKLHIEKEEDQIFPKIEENIEAEKLQEIGNKMQTMKEGEKK